jgi:hypothetical protein
MISFIMIIVRLPFLTFKKGVGAFKRFDAMLQREFGAAFIELAIVVSTVILLAATILWKLRIDVITDRGLAEEAFKHYMVPDPGTYAVVSCAEGGLIDPVLIHSALVKGHAVILAAASPKLKSKATLCLAMTETYVEWDEVNEEYGAYSTYLVEGTTVADKDGFLGSTSPGPNLKAGCQDVPQSVYNYVIGFIQDTMLGSSEPGNHWLIVSFFIDQDSKKLLDTDVFFQEAVCVPNLAAYEPPPYEESTPGTPASGVPTMQTTPPASYDPSSTPTPTPSPT